MISLEDAINIAKSKCDAIGFEYLESEIGAISNSRNSGIPPNSEDEFRGQDTNFVKRLPPCRHTLKRKWKMSPSCAT